MGTSFLNDAESLTTYDYTIWCSQKVCIRPYSLNIAFHPRLSARMLVFVWGRVRATILSYFTWPWPGLDSVSYSGCSIVPCVTR